MERPYPVFCNKVSCAIGILNRLRGLLPRNILITLYNVLIFPYLNYCKVVWGGTYPTRLLSLHILQKRAIRIIFNKDAKYHTYELFREIKNLSISDVNRFYISIFMYYWICGNLPSIFNNLFTLSCNIHDHSTHASRINFSLPFCRLTASQHSICFLGPKTWNNLPERLRSSSSSISTFKKSLKDHLMQI